MGNSVTQSSYQYAAQEITDKNPSLGLDSSPDDLRPWYTATYPLSSQLAPTITEANTVRSFNSLSHRLLYGIMIEQT
jgi:hypothetical protein